MNRVRIHTENGVFDTIPVKGPTRTNRVMVALINELRDRGEVITKIERIND